VLTPLSDVDLLLQSAAELSKLSGSTADLSILDKPSGNGNSNIGVSNSSGSSSGFMYMLQFGQSAGASHVQLARQLLFVHEVRTHVGNRRLELVFNVPEITADLTI
jgi:hypothetical protein